MSTEQGQYSEFGYEGDASAADVLRWAIGRYHPRIAIACSFQHAVLIHMALQVRPDVRVFSVDTGRLPEETYECARDIERFFNIRIEWYLPDNRKVEDILRTSGPFSFKESVDARRNCCAVRKIEPFKRALSGLEAWITGIRHDQNDSRKAAGKIERDPANGGIIKVNPIADWTAEQVKDYEQKHNLPYNKLFDKGYTSIGCKCCTRPIEAGEESRAGRWWWEESEHKECGLHVRNWSI